MYFGSPFCEFSDLENFFMYFTKMSWPWKYGSTAPVLINIPVKIIMSIGWRILLQCSIQKFYIELGGGKEAKLFLGTWYTPNQRV